MATRSNRRPPKRSSSTRTATNNGRARTSNTNGGGGGGGGPRRLGGNVRPPSNVNRYQRQRQARRKRVGWSAVVVVVVAVAVFAVVALTGSSSGNKPTTSGVTSGRKPKAMPAEVVKLMTGIPASTFDKIGVGSNGAAFTVTKGQTPLTTGKKPMFVYVGAEYCPWCALMRWALVAALSRFGTFSHLKMTSSDNAEYNIPTFSFLGAKYQSDYVDFQPYETADRNENPLQNPPDSVLALYEKYDGQLDSASPTGTKFDNDDPGIPFLDIANKYVSAGDQSWLQPLAPDFANGGPGASITSMASAISSPLTGSGKSIGTSPFIVQANYISAAICNADGNLPAAVCTGAGVKAAKDKLAAATPVG